MPLCMDVRRGHCALNVSDHHGDAAPGTAVRIPVPDADAVLAALGARGHPRLNPALEAVPRGARQVVLNDPFGNRRVFWSDAPA